MRRWLAKLHRIITRAETYGSFFTLIGGSSLFAYLVRQWDALREYSTVSVFLTSFAIVAATVCTVSLAYLAGSRFRERRGITSQPIDNDEPASHPIVAAVADLEFGDRVYIGDMTVSAGNIDELCIQISIRGYNATGETIRVDRVRGFLTAIKKVNGSQVRIGMQLPTPQITNHRQLDAGTPDQSEYFIILEQRIFPAVATDIQNLADGHSVQLECERLDIIAVAASEPRRAARLRLWDAVTITRSPHRFFSGRVTNARGISRAGAAQTEG